MRGFLTVARLTAHEAVRRRILHAALVCGAAFLVLYGIGFHFVERDLRAHGALSMLQRAMMLDFFVLAGLYAVDFLCVATSVLLPVDSVSGEIASGVMQTLAARPIRRAEILLGKWAGHLALVLAYMLVMAGGVLAIARLMGHFTPPQVVPGLALIGLECALLVTLSIAGGTRFATITNGLIVLGLHGLAFIGNWVEQIGAIAGNDAARNVGTVASLVMPSESLWQLAAWLMQSPVMRGLHATPFATASTPSGAMVLWAAGYLAVVLLAGLRRFQTRAL
ncbi:MAG TPA: ABC transporter permease [Terriglobales bacterium]|nr:ABC transporter permease [Terriglobales bacterium]